MRDFTLEARGGRTLLRVVNSGFGHGATWDDEIDGVSRSAQNKRWPIRWQLK